jgi:murein DD-endopeptidase MepM/ murein hydrolase activator NlpD
MDESDRPKNGKYSVLVRAPAGDRTYAFGMSPWILRVGLILLVILAAVIVVAAILYGRVIAKARGADDLRSEVERLEARLTMLEVVDTDTDRGGESRVLRDSIVEPAGIDVPSRADSLSPPDNLPEAKPIQSDVTDESPEAKTSTAEMVQTPQASAEQAERSSGGDSTEVKRESAGRPPTLGDILTEPPCRGHVARPFGSPSGDASLPGVEIAARAGTQVVAAGSGIVVRTNRDQVLGFVVVVDHGGGLLTLYGHNSNVFVAAGERVKAGQAIAEIGSTRLSSAPRLYFEVRRHGNAVDPGIVFPSLRAKRTEHSEQALGQGESLEQAVE